MPLRSGDQEYTYTEYSQTKITHLKQQLMVFFPHLIASVEYFFHQVEAATALETHHQ